jgi:predicted nuclease of predicted toxin-antitoxin system
MKLLFDQNISNRIIAKLKNFGDFDVKHIKDVDLHNASDYEIWQFAKIKGYTIVTQDVDFNEFSNLFGYPPKIIWLRLGNMRAEAMASELDNIVDLLLDFENNPILSLLEITNHQAD